MKDMDTSNERLGCTYCFKTLNPLDQRHDLRTFVRCSSEQKACASFYHQTCWDALRKCQCCEGEQATTVEIAEPVPLQVVHKTKSLPIKASAIVYRREELVVLAGLLLMTITVMSVLGYRLVHPKSEIPQEPKYATKGNSPEDAPNSVAIAKTTTKPVRPTAPSTVSASNSLPAPPAPAHEVRINYQSEATPYVEHMINHARDTEKVISAKNEIEKLRKPQRGERKKARKLNDEAIALIVQSRDTEAIPLLEEAQRFDPLDVEITNNLASAYFNTSFSSNDYRKAKAMLVDTLNLKPTRNVAWANLGRTFAVEGDEYASTNCYINFFRFSDNKEKALQRLSDSINEPHPVLSKALANAYQHVSTNISMR